MPGVSVPDVYSVADVPKGPEIGLKQRSSERFFLDACLVRGSRISGIEHRTEQDTDQKSVDLGIPDLAAS